MSAPPAAWRGRHLAALLVANIALALGPWSVRLADTGPIAAAFWRMLLPLPLLFGLAVANRQPISGFAPRTLLAIAIAGLFFAADLATWHMGIKLTRLGNAALFGNCGSLVVMGWGIIAVRRWPSAGEWAAVAAALAGAALLLGRSLEIGTGTVIGDLLCVLAGLFYAVYIIVLQTARARLGSWSLLAWATLAGFPLLYPAAVLHGEPVWPHSWWPLIALALGSQVIGQGLLVYALRHFRPLIIGLSLLAQPAMAVLVGWLAFGEALGAPDLVGMALIGTALVLARAAPAPPPTVSEMERVAVGKA